MALYPNPAEGEGITVKLGEGWFQPTVVLYDMKGRPVRSVSRQATTGGQVRIAVGDLSAGVYLVTAEENGHSETARVIVR